MLEAVRTQLEGKEAQLSRLFDANTRLLEENISLQTKLGVVSTKLESTLQEKEEDLMRLLEVNNRLSEENNSLQIGL